MTYLALLLSIAATLLSYLAAPQQRLLQSIPSYTKLFAISLQILALMVWIAATDIASGIFAWLCGFMLTAIALPYLALLRKRNTLMWGKLLAGITLGLPLSLFSLGTIVYAWPGAWQHSMILGMLLFFPLWIAVIAASPLFRSPARAWASLAGASIVAFGLLCLARTLGA